MKKYFYNKDSTKDFSKYEKENIIGLVSINDKLEFLTFKDLIDINSPYKIICLHPIFEQLDKFIEIPDYLRKMINRCFSLLSKENHNSSDLFIIAYTTKILLSFDLLHINKLDYSANDYDYEVFEYLNGLLNHYETELEHSKLIKLMESKINTSEEIEGQLVRNSKDFDLLPYNLNNLYSSYNNSIDLVENGILGVISRGFYSIPSIITNTFPLLIKEDNISYDVCFISKFPNFLLTDISKKIAMEDKFDIMQFQIEYSDILLDLNNLLDKNKLQDYLIEYYSGIL